MTGSAKKVYTFWNTIVIIVFFFIVTYESHPIHSSPTYSRYEQPWMEGKKFAIYIKYYILFTAVSVNVYNPSFRYFMSVNTKVDWKVWNKLWIKSKPRNDVLWAWQMTTDNIEFFSFSRALRNTNTQSRNLTIFGMKRCQICQFFLFFWFFMTTRL